MRSILLLAMLLGLVVRVYAQKDSTKSFPVTFSGYVEAYYLFDFSNPDDHNRPDFLYSYHRHNEVNLQMGLLSASYNSSRVRAQLSLMAGAYANRNLAAEPGVLRNIFEAYAGVRLTKNHQLWLDVGIFGSHIGFESALGADCWSMTRSMAAENSPYYSAGAQLTYTSPNEQWLLRAVLINGWQRIYRVNGNQLPAVGHQVTWTPNDQWTLNSSSFIGSDTPDSTRLMRYFHHFHGKWTPTPKFGLTLASDIGAQQTAPNQSTLNLWYNAVLVGRYAPTKLLALSARAEYYSDVAQIIITTGTPNGHQALGASLNVDFHLFDRALWRLEGRWFRSVGDAIFEDASGQASVDNFMVGTTLSVRF